MTKLERMKEIAKASPGFGKRVGYKMCVIDELHDIKELEKENAELKEQNRKLLESCEGATMMYEHLTKAKELLKKMSYEYQRLCLIKKETLTEAEQFLNSEV